VDYKTVAAKRRYRVRLIKRDVGKNQIPLNPPLDEDS